VEIFNLLDAELADEEERGEGWHLRSASATDVIGGVRIGGTVYELAEGQWTFPRRSVSRRAPPALMPSAGPRGS
jgi:hypothetical protein